MSRAWLDMGTNIDRENSIRKVLQSLSKQVRVLRTSSVYESAAYGPPGQPNFYNLSIEIETDLEPDALRRLLRTVEAEAGRVRSEDKFAPRTADLDLILYDDRTEQGDGWEVPHAQLENQPFVLVPVTEIAPDLRHPRSGQTLRSLLDSMNPSVQTIWKAAPPPLPSTSGAV